MEILCTLGGSTASGFPAALITLTLGLGRSYLLPQVQLTLNPLLPLVLQSTPLSVGRSERMADREPEPRLAPGPNTIQMATKTKF